MFKNNVEAFDAAHDFDSAVIIKGMAYTKDGCRRNVATHLSDIAMHEPLDDPEGRRQRWKYRFIRANELVKRSYDIFIENKQRLLDENSIGRARGSGPPAVSALSELKQLKAAYDAAANELAELQAEFARTPEQVERRRRESSEDQARQRCESFSAELHKIGIGIEEE